MKIRIFPLLAFCGALASSGLLARAVEPAPPTQPSDTATVSVPATAAPEFSGRINDVVSLAKSGVDESVVLSFIKASPGPFQPSADEIIKLRDEGISSKEISAMLERGAELRDQAAAVAAASAQPEAQAPVITSGEGEATQAPADVVQTPPLAYGSDSGSTVVYIGGNPYPVYYPWFSGFVSTAFFFPSPCWFNGRFFPHGCFFPHGGFIHGGRGFVARGGFNGGFHGGFHGGFVAHGNNGFMAGGFRGGSVGFHGSVNSGFHSFNPGFRSSAGFPGFRSFNSGFSAAPVGSGFHGPGFHGSVGGFHGGGSFGGFHGGMGGGFHGGGGGGFHGGGGMGGGHR